MSTLFNLRQDWKGPGVRLAPCKTGRLNTSPYFPYQRGWAENGGFSGSVLLLTTKGAAYNPASAPPTGWHGCAPHRSPHKEVFPMKIATRLTLGFALIILFICLQGEVALVKAAPLPAASTKSAPQDMPNVVMLSEIDENRHIIAEALRDMLIVKEVEHYEALKQAGLRLAPAHWPSRGTAAKPRWRTLKATPCWAMFWPLSAKITCRPKSTLSSNWTRATKAAPRNYLLDEFGTILNDYGRALGGLEKLAKRAFECLGHPGAGQH